MPIQSLKGLHGNYVRHFWGTIPLTGRGGAMTDEHPHTPSQKSHVIRLLKHSTKPRNVAIPTMPIQSLKGLHGNYVRHFWETIPLTGQGGAMTGRHPEAPRAASTTAKPPKPRALPSSLPPPPSAPHPPRMSNGAPTAQTPRTRAIGQRQQAHLTIRSL